MNENVQNAGQPAAGAPGESGAAIPLSQARAELRTAALALAATQQAPFFPPIVYIEPTNACNCNCVICPRRNMTREVGFMPMDLFRQIVGEISELGPSEIRLFNFGEPLLHPRLCEMVDYCREKSLPAIFQTNGLLLTERYIHDLLATGLDYIGVSVNGLNAQEYETIRPGYSFDTIRANLQRLRRMATGAGRPLHIHINAQILKEDKEGRMPEIREYVKSWDGVADSLSVSGLSVFDKIAFVNRGTVRESDLAQLPRKPDAKIKCTEPFDRLIVKWDGRVTVCCADFDAKMVIGHADRQRIADLWNSRALNLLRNEIREGRYGGIPLCRTCPKFYSDEFTLLFKKSKQQ